MNELTITRANNGFILEFEEETEDGGPYPAAETIQDDENDELKSWESLLWFVMEYFALGGSRYDKKRLYIARKQGDKYEPPEKREIE